MNLALPDATVKMKLLTSLSDEEQQSDSAVLEFLCTHIVTRSSCSGSM